MQGYFRNVSSSPTCFTKCWKPGLTDETMLLNEMCIHILHVCVTRTLGLWLVGHSCTPNSHNSYCSGKEPNHDGVYVAFQFVCLIKTVWETALNLSLEYASWTTSGCWQIQMHLKMSWERYVGQAYPSTMNTVTVIYHGSTVPFFMVLGFFQMSKRHK